MSKVSKVDILWEEKRQIQEDVLALWEPLETARRAAKVANSFWEKLDNMDEMQRDCLSEPLERARRASLAADSVFEKLNNMDAMHRDRLSEIEGEISALTS